MPSSDGAGGLMGCEVETSQGEVCQGEMRQEAETTRGYLWNQVKSGSKAIAIIGPCPVKVV